MKSAGPIFLAGCLLLGGCAAVGPNYRAPDLAPPAAYNQPDESSAKASVIESWWLVFADEQLNVLEARATAESPRLSAALSRVESARAQLGITRAERLPNLGASAEIQLAGETAAQATDASGQAHRLRGDDYRIPVNASYELDLWGRVRRSGESSQAAFAATEADQRGVWLTLTTDVAHYYFSLRALDEEIGIVADTARSRRESVAVNAARQRNGLSNVLDVQRARVEAANAEADLADLRRRREQTAGALAVATGSAPPDFVAPEKGAGLPPPPHVPAGLPAQLLARRPDLAQAEATLHARTADIGVATAARLPTISLTGSAGLSSTELGELVNRPSQFWNLGAGITAPLFDGGRLRARVAQARATADEALANYRQQALAAFGEVNNALVALRQQAAQETAQAEARDAALVVTQISRIRYEKGLTNYLDVTDAERSLLQLRRARGQLIGARYASTVDLIKALGGSWGPQL